MISETKPDAEVCSTCKHYHIDPQNVKQGVCRYDPPDSFPIPTGQVGGTMKLTVMMIPRQVPYDWNCRHWELPKQ